MSRKLLAVDWATLPWKLDEEGLFITDADGRKLLDIRGWGHLTGKAALALPDNEASDHQKELGEFIVHLVNTPIPDFKKVMDRKVVIEALRILQKKAIDVNDDGTGGAIKAINLEAIADQVLR